MEAPSWVKHFDESNRKDLSPIKDDKWTGWGRPPDSDDGKNKAVRNIQPYNGDYDRSSLSLSHSASELNLPRIHKIQTDPAISLSEEEKKVKKRRRRRMLEETSGYSTTSLSEVSELDTPRRERIRHSDLHVPSSKQKRDSDVRSELSRTSRGSQATTTTTRRESEANLRCGSDHTSRSTPNRRETRANHGRSTSDSVVSNTSVHSQRSNQRRPSNISSNAQKYATPNDRKVSQTHVDPFDFIQPVPEPFSRRMRKTLGPILGIMLMIVLAASLGAAIYFAVELKKTHEDEIEMLRANLALKIKSTTFGRSVDDLSQKDIRDLAMTYCQQMDTFYRRSRFESTYRGCEVLSIKNDNINFTLFFLEKDASKRDIISVIETSAPKVSNRTENVAVVDKFEIELESVKIKIEHERTPVGFSKIKSSSTKEEVRATTPTPPKTTVVTSVSPTTSSTSTTSGSSGERPTTTTEKQRETTVTELPTEGTTTDIWDDWTTTEAEITEEMLLAWDPCSKKNGSFFPHPIECHLYFQCSHKQSILQKCTGDLLFDADANNCVQDRPGLKCPDVDAAPPQPLHLIRQQQIPVEGQTTESATKKTTSAAKKTRPAYPGRPEYPKKPCLSADAGTLHAHPDDCAKFIQCIGGGAGKELKCATNLVYDPDTKACIFPRNDLICPDILPCLQKNNGYFPHPFNCSLYIQCESGREKTQQCATGLIWDPNVNSCVVGTVDNSICNTI